MKEFKMMQDQLMSVVKAQMGDLSCVDTNELGEAIDMIKDLSQTMYYCAAAKALEGEEPSETRYYGGPRRRMPYPDYDEDTYYRDMDRDKGRMYYKERYDTREYPMMRDRREGRSPELRKHYMESKELHHDTAVSMKELESYLNELSKDIVEMVDDATPDEKALLQKKLQTLASKVV
jgi:hypothetical protein|nr:MAG TPA: hypothetical protein [Caudoviricetes sp.]